MTNSGSTPLAIYGTTGNAVSYFFDNPRYHPQNRRRCYGCPVPPRITRPRRGRPFYVQLVVPARDMAGTIPLAFDYIMNNTRPV